MKKILLLASAFLTMQVNAQIQMPKASPLGKIEQKVGLADISISYSRPGKKNRDVFGEVVPFGETWRLGANENTKITTSENLIFGKDLSTNLLVKTKQAIIISKILQPINTLQRFIVLLSPNSELENGFFRSATKINSLLKQLGVSIYVYGLDQTIRSFATAINDKKQTFYKYMPILSFNELDVINKVKVDDLFIFLSARKQTLSYDFNLDEMPKKLNKNNEFTSFIIFYTEIPKILQNEDINNITNTSIEKNYVKVKKITGKITGIFKKEDYKIDNSEHESDDKN